MLLKGEPTSRTHASTESSSSIERHIPESLPVVLFQLYFNRRSIKIEGLRLKQSH